LKKSNPQKIKSSKIKSSKIKYSNPPPNYESKNAVGLTNSNEGPTL
ncbi:hypothetical protein LV89_02232, partial [Arcicella aurantiaca]